MYECCMDVIDVEWEYEYIGRWSWEAIYVMLAVHEFHVNSLNVVFWLSMYECCMDVIDVACEYERVGRWSCSQHGLMLAVDGFPLNQKVQHGVPHNPWQPTGS